MGMSIGHHPQQSQFTPDMRKDDSEISETERADAKRRIEGSLAPAREEDPTSAGLGAAVSDPERDLNGK